MSAIDVAVPQMVPTGPGKPKGGKNCNCAVGASCVIHATGGAVRPSAEDVRDGTRNPNGSPDVAGGTNLRQVDDSINRLYGVDLDVHTPIAWDAAWDRLEDPLVFASVSVRYGVFRGTPAYASRTGFMGNHQIGVRRIPGSKTHAEMFDPLADGKRGVPQAPVRVTKELLGKAAGALVLNEHTGQTVAGKYGKGSAFVGFARAPKPPEVPVEPPKRYAVVFTPGEFFEYTRTGDVLTERESHRFRRKTSAPCEAPERLPYPTATSARRRVVLITAGVLKGSYVEPGRAHVELIER